MGEWKTYRLGEITSYISRGITPSYCDTGLTIINQKCIRNGVVDFSQVKYTDPQKKIPSDKILQDRDILINSTGTGTLGRVSIYHQIGQQCTVDSHVTIVRSSKDIDATFLGYNLINQQYNIESLATGSTGQTELPRARLASEIEILLPPLEEQRRIAGILGSLDDKIELNRRINANLEAQAQALFRSWFVDFEPFRDGPFVDSELGKIPQGWKVGNYTDIVEIKGGGTPKTGIQEYWNGTIPFFSPKDVGASCFVLDTEKHITAKGLENCNSSLFQPNTVFITARGTVGKVVMTGTEMAMNQTNYALLGKQNISQYYVYHITLQLVARLLKKANGAVFNAITTRDFTSEQIVIPPFSTIRQFSDAVKPIYENILLNDVQSNRLSALRDTLLPKLMAGEIAIE